MFGFFKGNQEVSRFKFICPMCGSEYSLKFNPSDLAGIQPDYPYRKTGVILSDEEKCGFCKTALTLVYYAPTELYPEEKLKAYDDKWERVEHEYYVKSEALEDQLESLDEQIPSEQKKIEKLEAQLEKLEERYDSAQDRYEERRDNWHSKR